ncbi:DUF3885 domain-containing protein [Sporosarcina aquimarina]|uniref:DUF3885 domain-containing protein n=1 Tax=Sporosarcina aquimarina TaxID=114975 RepID=UPI002040F66F|nr:DUF3885 domain-containing protein [Sporosarcina aquimarina]MCM3758542.1 DUF3885 domain-containing protein [Sporosarcina aquimarina]
MQNLESFFDQKFNGVTLQPPLFNSWDSAIRFDLLTPSSPINHNDALEHAFQRSITLYDEVFRDEDELLVIADVRTTEDHLFLEEPLRVYRSYIKQEDVLTKLRHELIPDGCNEEGEQMVVHRFTLGCRKMDIRYELILREICYKDFGEVMRQLDQKPQSGIEFYFINLTRGIIYHLYDGPGCDVLALKKEEIQFLYESYNDWIREEDRDQIDAVFSDPES